MLDAAVARLRAVAGDISKTLVPDLLYLLTAAGEQPEGIAEESEIQKMADVATDLLLGGLEQAPSLSEIEPAHTPPFPRRLAHEIISLAAARIWRELTDLAGTEGQDLLRDAAHRLFLTSQRLTATYSSTEYSFRQEVASLLLAGLPAQRVTEEAGIPIPERYMVSVTKRPPTSVSDPYTGSRVGRFLPRDHRESDQGFFVTRDHGECIILIPLRPDVPNAEGKVIACRYFAGLDGAPDSRVGLCLSTSRDEVPDAARMAHDALQVAENLRYPPGFYQIEDVATEVALLRAPELARALTARIHSLIDSRTPFLATLRAYDLNGCDRRATAAELHIHPNTLDYRFTRIYELTGLSPTNVSDYRILQSAMAARDLLA